MMKCRACGHEGPMADKLVRIESSMNFTIYPGYNNQPKAFIPIYYKGERRFISPDISSTIIDDIGGGYLGDLYACPICGIVILHSTLVETYEQDIK